MKVSLNGITQTFIDIENYCSSKESCADCELYLPYNIGYTRCVLNVIYDKIEEINKNDL